jgi:predicted transposase/invertase (TIGR01784 family)
MHLNEKEREYYEAQQKRCLDETSRIQEVLEEAVEKTELKSKIEIAKNLIRLNASTDFISKATNLPFEQIEHLRHKKQ